MIEFTDVLPASAKPLYELSDNGVVFILNKNQDNTIEIIKTEITAHRNCFNCPLSTNLSPSEIKGFKLHIECNLRGEAYNFIIVDGGDRGKGAFCGASKGAIL